MIFLALVLAMVYFVIFAVEVVVAGAVLLFTLIEVAVRGLVRSILR